MIARTAAHAFELGRTLERSEATLRLLELGRALEADPWLRESAAWPGLLAVTGEETAFVERWGRRATQDREAVEGWLAREPAATAGVARSAAVARVHGEGIRDVLTDEVWDALCLLGASTGPAGGGRFASDRSAFYRDTRREAQLALGLLGETLAHDLHLDFMRLGVQLERAAQAARLLQLRQHLAPAAADLHPVLDTALWAALLRAASGEPVFLRRHRGQVSASAIAQFLILEPAFPRSLRRATREAHRFLRAIRPDGGPSVPGARTLSRLRALEAWLDQIPASIEPHAIPDMVAHVLLQVVAAANGIDQDMFGHVPGPDEPTL